MDAGEREVRAWLEEQVGRCYRSMYFTAASILPNREDAQEITQEAALRASRTLLAYATLPEEERRAKLPEHPKAWLLQITRNAALDRRKRKDYSTVKDTEGLLNYPDAPAADVTTQRELHARLLEEIGALPEKQAVALTLLYQRLREQPQLWPSASELAGELGIKPGTLSKRVFDAMRNLRRRLDDVQSDWEVNT